MATYWNFPATVGGNVNSINNAGLETFRGNALEALTREICQNSLDAIRDITKPVIVEFSSFALHKDNFPNRSELIDTFQQCEQTWKNRNAKSEEFIKNALGTLSKEKIHMLRISDFNTKGLEGARDATLGSPWSSLIKESGSSNKDDSSGGSFGIGKSAPFLNSNLRTLFYSSYDITGYESHIGVAKIMSYHLPNDKTTIGEGYYTNSVRSTAIRGQLPLDENFTRNASGTDIYVTAFEPKGDWKKEVTKAVLNSFFITIQKKKLVVKIDGFTIDESNIVELINKLEDNQENRVLKQYCAVLTSDKTIEIPYPEKRYKNGIRFGEGEAVLYLLSGEDLNRKVLMTRNTGMKIFEQNRISGSISFTGILSIIGPNMNTIFKEMENPEHNKWEPNRYESDPKLADKIFGDVRRFMREVVKEQFQEKVTDKMDAVGLSDFLPNKNLLEDGSDREEESITSRVKEVVPKKVDKKKRKRKPKKGLDKAEMEDEMLGGLGISPTGDEGGPGDGEHQGGSGSGGGTGVGPGENEIDENWPGNKDKQRKRKPSTRPIPMNQRYLCLDKNTGKYRFNITAEKALSKARLEFRVIGEQSDFNLPILDAETNGDIVIEAINSNKVEIGAVKKNQAFILDIAIDYSDYCVLEVILYEN